MELKLKRVRLAFLNGYRPGKATTDKATGKVTPGKYSVNGIFEISDPDPMRKAAANAELQKVIQCISAVAREKWAERADMMIQSLRAKGDLCLRDGAAKAEYDGFAGNAFIAASNAVQPAIVAPMMYGGKVVYVEEDGRGFITDPQGNRTLVEGQKFKAPYAGCYANLQLDVWAQDNEYGKRINCKLLGIQFCEDGNAFSGGAGFDEAGFDYSDGGAAAADPWGAGAAAAPAAGGFAFGAQAPAPAAGGFAFGGTPAPTPAAGGFNFGGGADIGFKF